MGWDHTPNTATTTRAPVVLIKDTRHNINTGMFLASLSLAELLLLLVYIPLEVFFATFTLISSADNFHFFSSSCGPVHSYFSFNWLFLIIYFILLLFVSQHSSWDVIHFHFSFRLFFKPSLYCSFGVLSYFPHHVIFFANSLLYFTVSSAIHSFFTCSLWTYSVKSF